MAREILEPRDDDNFDCPLQDIEIGGLVCRGAEQKGGQATNKTNEKFCFNCDIGKVYRDVGCDNVSGTTRLYQLTGSNTEPILRSFPESVFCNIRKRKTTLDFCEKCDLVTAGTTKEIVSNTKGLFEAHGFYTAYKQIEEARKDIRDGKFEHVITLSIAFLESTMKICHEKLKEPLPKTKALVDLWKSTRKILQFDEIDPNYFTIGLLNALSGLFTHLGSVRNNLSDAHGDGEEPTSVDYMIAELALKISSTLSTTIVRRFNQIKGEKENE